MADEKIKILYIDDEPNNLIGFKAAFRHDYNVLIANSADEGMEVVEKNADIKIIFSDQRMPGKTGVDFFKEVSLKHPLPVRMLLTGYTDLESVITAINSGHIYRYLTKPWNENEIRGAIEEGYQYYMTSSMLSAKNEELQKANEELDKFAYSVTHDIRGPIVSLMGALEIMKGADDVNEMRSVAEMMQVSVEKVNDFIENIHAYYNLKRGDLNIEEIDFNTLLNEVVPIHKVNATLNKVQIDTEVNQTEIFRNDKIVLQLVINNLLLNGIKYQRKEEPNKFVRITVKVEKGIAEIAIKDNGIGIDQQHLDDIFKMFFRATKESTGAGFGLYNVKDALNKIGGQVSVNSTVGAGSEFVVTIPTK